MKKIFASQREINSLATPASLEKTSNMQPMDESSLYLKHEKIRDFLRKRKLTMIRNKYIANRFSDFRKQNPSLSVMEIQRMALDLSEEEEANLFEQVENELDDIREATTDPIKFKKYFFDDVGPLFLLFSYSTPLATIISPLSTTISLKFQNSFFVFFTIILFSFVFFFFSLLAHYYQGGKWKQFNSQQGTVHAPAETKVFRDVGEKVAKDKGADDQDCADQSVGWLQHVADPLGGTRSRKEDFHIRAQPRRPADRPLSLRLDHFRNHHPQTFQVQKSNPFHHNRQRLCDEENWRKSFEGK